MLFRPVAVGRLYRRLRVNLSYSETLAYCATARLTLSGVQARSVTVSTCHSANEETRPALARLMGSRMSGNGVPSKAQMVGVGVAVGFVVGVRVNAGVGLTVALGTRVMFGVRDGSGMGVAVLGVGLMIEHALKPSINMKA